MVKDIEKSIIPFYGLWFLFSGFSNYIPFLLFLCNFLFFIIGRISKLPTKIIPNEDIIKILFYIFANITFWIMEIGSKLIKAFDKEEPIYRKIQLLFSIFVLCTGSLIILYDDKSSLSSLLNILQQNKFFNYVVIFLIFIGPIGVGIGMYFFIKSLVSYDIKEDIHYKGIHDIITFLIFIILLAPYLLYIIIRGTRPSTKEIILVSFIVLCALVACIVYIYHKTTNSDNGNEGDDEGADVNDSDDTSDEGDDEGGGDEDENTECDIDITIQ